ncbi:hypothetical protein EA472_14235 [Natrarchaeobius oligotrophus]|uniref:DUF7344 domain-containing protein n=2 Tax=Natrarchaeobius TaxID=2501796 RepID=A0A3N6MF17_NATCH|nr:hypothetical protein EA472_14235 [Natrarchaeobius chitinivorans]
MDAGLSTDEVLRLLSDARIRTIVTYLYDRPDATLEELAAIVATVEAARSSTIATPTDYERATVELYHSTLPRLDDHEFVSFDPDEGIVRATDVPPPVHALLGITDPQ